MRCLFIYGPPASGKFTIASIIAEKTDYSLFHNHLTRDIVKSMYPSSLKENYELVTRLREVALAYCAENNTNIIFTFVYDGPGDDEILRRKVEAVSNAGGEVIFVELVAPEETLLSRVSNDSRKTLNKLTDVKDYKEILRENTYTSVPYKNLLKIDTSKKSAEDSAEEILSAILDA